MKYVLALDQGTTSSRAIIYDETLAVKGVGQYSFEQIYPQPGWVEHDPEKIWQTVQNAIADALTDAKIDAAEITAIGITNQRETIVVWDKRSGAPIANAIVWQDRRTADTCHRLKAQGLETDISGKTGLLLDPYFSATKIQWLLDEHQGARGAAERGELICGTIDSWLVWKLSEGASHVIEASNASRTLLLDIASCTWDQQLLDTFSIPGEMLPRVVASSGNIAEATVAPFSGVPITGIAGDQQAALFGQTCFSVGEAKCTYGTGCFLLTNTGNQVVRSTSRLLSTVAWSIDEQVTYALEGSVFIGGALIQWLRDNLSLVEHASEIEALADSVPDNGGVTLVPAFAGLGAPHWDPEARGTLLGITRGTSKGHIARAALEGIAMQVTDVVEAMSQDLGAPLARMKVDGGASANNLLLQMQADFSGLQVSRASNLESTALGAASLAGLGAKVWSDTATLQTLWQNDSDFNPALEPPLVNRARQTWLRAIERAGQWSS